MAVLMLMYRGGSYSFLPLQKKACTHYHKEQTLSTLPLNPYCEQFKVSQMNIDYL